VIGPRHKCKSGTVTFKSDGKTRLARLNEQCNEKFWGLSSHSWILFHCPIFTESADVYTDSHSICKVFYRKHMFILYNPIQSNEISRAQVQSSLPASCNQVHIQIGTLPEPVRLALKLKLNKTFWLSQCLSKRFLKMWIVSASAPLLGKLFHTLTNAYLTHFSLVLTAFCPRHLASGCGRTDKWHYSVWTIWHWQYC